MGGDYGPNVWNRDDYSEGDPDQEETRTDAVRFTITESQARRLASHAVQGNEWDTLDTIEAAMRAAGYDGRTAMDVYAENNLLHKRIRALEAES